MLCQEKKHSTTANQKRRYTKYMLFSFSVFIELFPCRGAEQRHKMVQGGYEAAIHSTGERKQVKLLWTEYLHYMSRQLKDKQCSADEIHEIFHRCLITVLAVTPLLYVGSKSWSDYHFHNEVIPVECFFNVLNLYLDFMLGETFLSSCSSMVRASHWSSECYRLYTYVTFTLSSQSM